MYQENSNEVLRLHESLHKGEFAKLRVQFISLVKHPANRRPVLVKSGDGVTFDLPIRILRKDGSRRLIYGVVYEPGLVDTQGDSASGDVIKDAAHEFLRLGLVKMIDFQHDFDPGKGSVVESFILNGVDDRFPNIAKGAWVVAIELSPEMEPYIDEIGGLSLAGQGVYKGSSQHGKDEFALSTALSNITTTKTTTHKTSPRTQRALARKSSHKRQARALPFAEE